MHFRPALCLTAPGVHRSRWRLPAWFHPAGRAVALSYHYRPERWKPQGESVLLQTVGRGQEFVLDCDVYPEAVTWLAQLLSPVCNDFKSSRRNPLRIVLYQGLDNDNPFFSH